MFSKLKSILAAAALALAPIASVAPPAQAAYDQNAKVLDFFYPALDWHAGTVTRYGQCPAGMMGIVQDVMISPTTSFVGTSTPAAVQVGYGSAANLYAWANVYAGSTLNVTTVSGSASVVVNSSSGGIPTVGDVITGTNIAGATTITAVSVTNGITTLTISNTATGSGTQAAVTAAQIATPHMASTYAQGILQLGSTGGNIASGAGYMPANTPFIFTFVPSTGGGVAGVADVLIRVKCF